MASTSPFDLLTAGPRGSSAAHYGGAAHHARPPSALRSGTQVASVAAAAASAAAAAAHAAFPQHRPANMNGTPPQRSKSALRARTAAAQNAARGSAKRHAAEEKSQGRGEPVSAPFSRAASGASAGPSRTGPPHRAVSADRRGPGRAASGGAWVGAGGLGTAGRPNGVTREATRALIAHADEEAAKLRLQRARCPTQCVSVMHARSPSSRDDLRHASTSLNQLSVRITEVIPPTGCGRSDAAKSRC